MQADTNYYWSRMPGRFVNKSTGRYSHGIMSGHTALHCAYSGPKTTRQRIVELLTEALLDTDFSELKSLTSNLLTEFETKAQTESHMTDLNHQVCLKFLHLHNLKGVDNPTALYRVSESALRLNNDIFTNLLSKLASETLHVESVKAVFEC